jgi:hypothetical protein
MIIACGAEEVQAFFVSEGSKGDGDSADQGLD